MNVWCICEWCFVKRTQLWNHSTSKKRQPTSRGRKAETTDNRLLYTSMHWAPSTALQLSFRTYDYYIQIFFYSFSFLCSNDAYFKRFYRSRLDWIRIIIIAARNTQPKKKPSKSPLSSPATHIIPKKKIVYNT